MVNYRLIYYIIIVLTFSASLLNCNAFDTADAIVDDVDPDNLVTSTNVPPTALIESITPNSANEGDTVTFTGSGSDTDGSIAAYRWRSSIDDNLGDSASFSSTSLSVGVHTISFEVQDDKGDWSNPVTLDITIHTAEANLPPTALIESITPDSASEGDPVTFTGSGSDTDGSIAAYRWSSSLDGNLGDSASFSSTTLSVGAHTISFEVQDDKGGWSDPVTLGVTIYATGTNIPPTALIESITPESASEGDVVTFTGSGSDTDGSIAAYRWSSSLDGNLGDSASFSSTTLSVGTHTISFEVQDDKGLWSAAETQALEVNITSADVFPGEHWATATPESQGVDSSVLQQAVDYFDANAGGAGADEMVIVRNGYVISKGAGVENAHEIFSGSKVFTTTVLGLLIQENLIAGVDSKAVDYYPALDDGYGEYAGITFKHLATMTSGYDGINGSCWELYQQGDYEGHNTCVRTTTTPGPSLFDPGTAYKYHDPSINMLGYLMTRISGESLEDIFKTRIADPIGMKTFTWTNYGMMDGLDGVIFNNPAGTPGIDQGGVQTTPEDAARVGLLFLNKGRWDGQQLLDEGWVAEATTNQVPASLASPFSFDKRGSFGYMWYTNAVGSSGTRQWPSAPPNAYTSIGYSGNYCFVIPEWNMVIVRMSPVEAGSTNNSSTVWDAFFKMLKDGIS